MVNSIDRIIDLCKKHQVNAISVFGSAARDEMSISSDIDFLVHFSEKIELQGKLSLWHVRHNAKLMITVHDGKTWIVNDSEVPEATILQTSSHRVTTPLFDQTLPNRQRSIHLDRI